MIKIVGIFPSYLLSLFISIMILDGNCIYYAQFCTHNRRANTKCLAGNNKIVASLDNFVYRTFLLEVKNVY